MPDTSAEMSKYINIDNYNRYEEGHPGYREMMNVVLNQTIGRFGGKIGKILEIGAGTGNYTRRIGETHTADIDTIEIDPGCSDYVRHKIDTSEIENTRLMTDDFFRWASAADQKYNAVNTTFADHHFSPAQKPEFFKRIVSLLKQGGEYIMGDEFLPPHDESNPAERVTAQMQYHGMIIEEAFKEGKIELPNLELDALVSGLRTTVRFIQQTVPGRSQDAFENLNEENTYNKEGIEELAALISRLEKIDLSSLANPEQIVSAELQGKRTAFLERLEDLKHQMQISRQAGLEENADQGLVGGDYKMTIRQYTDYLAKAGFKAIGYFEGPKLVGSNHLTLDEGTGMHSISLVPGKDHAGGVWVIRAIADKLDRAVSAHALT